MTQKYFLDSDGDGHWYVVPDDKRDAWDEWLDDDMYSGEPEPDGVARINCHPRWIVFSDYEER